MQVTHSTPDNGDITFTTVTISIGWCVITHIDTPSLPTSAESSYIIFSSMMTLTLSPAFTQVPNCGYIISENIQWTIPDSTPITETSDPYVLEIVSTDGLSHHAVNPVILQNFVTYDTDTWSPFIEFSITITDPCRTSTITAIDLVAMTVVLGEEEFQDFLEAVDSAGTTYGATVCGNRVYEVLDFSTGLVTDVAAVINGDNAGEYKIRAYSEEEAKEGTHNL